MENKFCLFEPKHTDIYIFLELKNLAKCSKLIISLSAFSYSIYILFKENLKKFQQEAQKFEESDAVKDAKSRLTLVHKIKVSDF